MLVTGSKKLLLIRTLHDTDPVCIIVTGSEGWPGPRTQWSLVTCNWDIGDNPTICHYLRENIVCYMHVQEFQILKVYAYQAYTQT